MIGSVLAEVNWPPVALQTAETLETGCSKEIGSDGTT